MLPRRIVLSGGGINVIAHVGALQQLASSSILHISHIQEWMGVSAGALMAFCMTIGYTLEELEHFFLEFDFRNITDIDSAPGWIINYGMDTGEKLMKFVHACLHVKGLSDSVTFEQLHTITSKSLRIFFTDLNDATFIECSYKKTPHRNVAEAICASMSIPYYFQPVIDKETSHYLIDGGVVSNYPLHILQDHELTETLGIILLSQQVPLHEFKLEDFALRPLQILMNTRSHRDIKHYQPHTIIVPVGSRSAVNFDIDENERKNLLEIGKKAVISYQKHKRKQIQRRYSVS
jgi:predicted acylesterase/phospholipase RssA